MRVLVCGGRNFTDAIAFANAMDAHFPPESITHIINGGAPGADALSRKWAYANRVQLDVYYADWGQHGKAAGPIRNQRMLDEGKPDVVMAFPGGKGTADMVRRAEKAGVGVIRALETVDV